MTALVFDLADRGRRIGLKGPRAAEWLAARGLEVPAAPNTWTSPAQDLLVARLGSSEFFLEEESGRGASFTEAALGLAGSPPGVYPVLREDFAFRLSGMAVHDALAQVCNVNFAALDLTNRPVVMTLMIGVAVLVVPRAKNGEREYRFWCDPTYGPCLSETLGEVIVECGGTMRGVSA
jgi:sarcosine oxidase, subunit gamma